MSFAKAGTTQSRRGIIAFSLTTKLAVSLVVIGSLIVFLVIQVEKVQESAARAHCNLSGVTLAFHGYHDKHGRFPPPYSCDKYENPLLSWRVLLLPFIEHQDLFDQFKLDEPWDSPHNLQLLPKMPPSYAFPREGRIPPHHTVLHVFVGKGTAFEGPEGLQLKSDFPDGTSNTILIVEAGKPVPWTKPEDLPYDADQPLPELTTYFRGGFRVGMVDGTRLFLPKEIDEAKLRAAITRNGEEKVYLDR